MLKIRKISLTASQLPLSFLKSPLSFTTITENLKSDPVEVPDTKISLLRAGEL